MSLVAIVITVIILKRTRTEELFYLLLLSIFLMSCKKNWLDAKPDTSLVVPSSLKDFQALLDNSSNTFNVDQPAFGEISSTDFYIQDGNWQALYTYPERNAYIWAKDIYGGNQDYGDWNTPYKQVFYANVVLEGINDITPSPDEQSEWNNIRGSALFYRAYAFYNLVQTFAKPYDSATANNDLGIPLRLSSDVKQKSARATVQDCYNQIISDLLQAEQLLPVKPLYKTRPSVPACKAMLSRINLAVNNYKACLAYSDSCLQLYNSLVDFNTLDSTLPNPIPLFNEEDIFHSVLVSYGIFDPANLIVDPTLYGLYNSNDLRKSIYFFDNGDYLSYRGSYDQSTVLYGGLATDEVYLNRSECFARLGDKTSALKDLNTLLQTRWRAGTYTPITATTDKEALTIITNERHKELIFRGIRWNDLRRLNKDPQFAVTLYRTLNGQDYTLPPNNPKYIFPIPDKEIELSDIEQNSR